MPILRTPDYGPEPDVQVELSRFPVIPLPEAQPRPARPVTRQAPVSHLAPSVRPEPSRAPPAKAIQARPPPIPPRPAIAAAPAPPSTASASIPAQGGKTGQAVGGAAGGRAPANYPGDEERDGVRSFLRATVGCSHEEYLHLNAAERANCDKRVGKDARAFANVNIDALPADKRAYYDAVQQAYQSTHDPRTPVDTSAGGGTWTGQGGHGLGFGCKAGKCGVQLPQGVGTEEVDTPKP
jgi:hypothetical protein